MQCVDEKPVCGVSELFIECWVCSLLTYKIGRGGRGRFFLHHYVAAYRQMLWRKVRKYNRTKDFSPSLPLPLSPPLRF